MQYLADRPFAGSNHINYAGTQVTQWDFPTTPARLCFVFFKSLRAMPNMADVSKGILKCKVEQHARDTWNHHDQHQSFLPLVGHGATRYLVYIVSQIVEWVTKCFK